MRHKTPLARRNSGTRGISPAHHAPSARVLHFEISRITLEGYRPADQAVFARSLEARLAELAQAHRGHAWSPTSGRRIRRLKMCQLPAGASASETARRVAQQIFAALIEEPMGIHHA